MLELLRVGQCCRELQARTLPSAVKLLLFRTVPSEPICSIIPVPSDQSEKRVQRLLRHAEVAGELEMMADVESFKEVLYIQLGLARVARRERRLTLRFAITLVLRSVSCTLRRLEITDLLVQLMFARIELYDAELDLEIGEVLSDIAQNWRQEIFDECNVGNLIQALRCLRSVVGTLRRLMRRQDLASH